MTEDGIDKYIQDRVQKHDLDPMEVEEEREMLRKNIKTIKKKLGNLQNK